MLEFHNNLGNTVSSTTIERFVVRIGATNQHGQPYQLFVLKGVGTGMVDPLPTQAPMEEATP